MIVINELRPNYILVIIIFLIIVRLTRQYIGYRFNVASWKINYLAQRIKNSSKRKEKIFLQSIIVLKFLDYLNLMLIVVFLVLPIFINLIKPVQSIK